MCIDLMILGSPFYYEELPSLPSWPSQRIREQWIGMNTNSALFSHEHSFAIAHANYSTAGTGGLPFPKLRGFIYCWFSRGSCHNVNNNNKWITVQQVFPGVLSVFWRCDASGKFVGLALWCHWKSYCKYCETKLKRKGSLNFKLVRWFLTFHSIYLQLLWNQFLISLCETENCHWFYGGVSQQSSTHFCRVS